MSIRKSALAIGLSTVLGFALPQVSIAKTLSIGIDLSGSNPLLMDANFADGAARYIYEQIDTLEMGDQVQILTLGARDSSQNLRAQRVTISRKNRPKKVAQQVRQFVEGLPRAKELSQSSTNLIAWLEFTDGFNCDASGEIIILTDGIEYSSLVNGQHFVEGKIELPKPEVDLNGCSLTFYGLGVGFPIQSVRHIRSSWKDWSNTAGADFKAVIP